MKRILIVALAVLMIAAAAFAYLLKTDENGRPYGVYEVNVVGSGGGAGSMYLLNSTGTTPLYTYSNGGTPSEYFLGTFNILNGTSSGGTLERIHTTQIGGNYALDVKSVLYNSSNNPIGSTYVGGPYCLNTTGVLGQPYTNQWVSMSTCSTTGVSVGLGGTPNLALAVKEHDDSGNAIDYISLAAGVYGVRAAMYDTSGDALDISLGAAKSLIEWYDGTAQRNNLITHPIPFALYGYPSSAQNLFENANARPLYTKKAGGTITGTTTGNGTTTIFTPTGAAVVSNVVLTTESNAGSVVIEFAAGTDIAKIYCAAQKSFNSGEIKSTGSTGNAVQIVRASFAGSEEVFYSITYTEE